MAISTTYVPIESKTLGSAANNITFTSIPQTYTDLVLVFNGDLTSITGCSVRVGNGSIDTGNNYSLTRMWGKVDGTKGSNRESSGDQIRWDYWAAGNGSPRNAIFHFQNYSNTTTYKTILTRTNIPSTETLATVGLWRSTSAINQVSLMLAGGTTYTAGSTATLYGIAAAPAAGSNKATGGTITVGSGYTYHAFTAGGTFTPNQDITADILVIAGGGGGGYYNGAGGGGGGAGGLLFFPNQSLTSGTGYTVTVGSGGAYSTSVNVNGTNGIDSQFGALTLVKGGGGGGTANSSGGSNGGSGGGGGSSSNNLPGGSGTSGQGNAGGYGTGAALAGGGGGGGASSAGLDGTGSNGGNGGSGTNVYYDWAAVTSTGSNGYYAGGGGAGIYVGGGGTSGTGGAGGGANAGTNGTSNTGGGGGGAYYTSGIVNGGNGGSGLVIVRYAN